MVKDSRQKESNMFAVTYDLVKELDYGLGADCAILSLLATWSTDWVTGRISRLLKDPDSVTDVESLKFAADFCKLFESSLAARVEQSPHKVDFDEVCKWVTTEVV
jgi:hypothetical protein